MKVIFTVMDTTHTVVKMRSEKIYVSFSLMLKYMVFNCKDHSHIHLLPAIHIMILIYVYSHLLNDTVKCNYCKSCLASYNNKTIGLVPYRKDWKKEY